jgi:UDP-N-acetylmuramoyl-tripeptide--D-alanyl-D-alanine ligase
VVHALPDEIPLDVPLILVDDTTRALGRLAAFHRSRFSSRSWPSRVQRKTTTKEMIAAILAGLGPVPKAEELQQPVGPSPDPLRLTPEHRAVALELGRAGAETLPPLSDPGPPWAW